MTKYIVAAVLIGALVTPALALESGAILCGPRYQRSYLLGSDRNETWHEK